MIEKVALGMVKDAVISGGLETFSAFFFTGENSQHYITDIESLLEAKEALDPQEWEKLNERGREKQIGSHQSLHSFIEQSDLASKIIDQNLEQHIMQIAKNTAMQDKILALKELFMSYTEIEQEASIS